MKNKFILKKLHIISKFRADRQGKGISNEQETIPNSLSNESHDDQLKLQPIQRTKTDPPLLGKIASGMAGKVQWQQFVGVTKQIFCATVYLMLWAATSVQVAFGSIEGVSSLGFAPPSTEMGKKSTPALTDDQVNSVGAFQYSIPLEFPAGREDMKPLISINYSSNAPLRGSVLGAGWQLSVPKITGDTSRPSVDKTGENQSITHYVSAFMGGGKLIRQSDSPIANNNVEVYFALNDNKHVRYERHLNPAPGAGFWLVRPGNGFIYEFGLSSAGHTYYNAPIIRQTHEVSGAVIEYEWEQTNYQYAPGAPDSVEQKLNRIVYKTSKTAASAFAEVSLTYFTEKLCGASPFPVGAKLDFHYGDSPQISGTQGLRSIIIRARRPQADGNGGYNLDQELSNVRQYEFTYNAESEACDFNLGSPLRRLDQVQETAYAPVTGKATQLPPIQFGYGTFEPAESRIYEEREFANLTLARGEDLRHNVYKETGVSHMLADIDGDGYEDLVVREVDTTDTQNLAKVYYNIDGTGFSSTGISFSFPEWLPEELSKEIPDASQYQDVSLGLSGQIKYYADFTWTPQNFPCGQVIFRTGSKERFGLYDVNHDGLLDAVTELEYDPKWVNGDRLGFPNTAFGIQAINDDGSTFNPCTDAFDEQRVRWPVWRVRYNFGNGFSNSVVEVDAPLPLPGISVRGSMGTPGLGGVRTNQRNFQGDLNGDGLGDILDKVKFGPGQSTAEFVYNAQGFFVPGPIDDPSKYGAPEGTRWMVVGDNDGLLHRVPADTFGWTLPGTLQFLSSSEELNLGNGHYRYNTLVGAADINGDGLQDIVSRSHGTNWRFEYFPNNGRRWMDEGVLLGRAANSNPVDYLGRSGSLVLETDAGQPTKGSAYNLLIQEDINNDDLVDMIRLGDPTNKIYVYMNDGLRFSRDPSVLSLTSDDISGGRMTYNLLTALDGRTRLGEAVLSDGPGHWRKTGGYVDLTGDGLKDLVVWDFSARRYKLFAALPDAVTSQTLPPYLLVHINDGQGLNMWVDYASTAERDIVTQGELDGEWHSVRNPRWVVKSTTVSPSWGIYTNTSYSYHYPVYAQDYYGKYQLRGFKERIKTLPTGAEVIDRYDYDLHYAGLPVEQVTYTAENPDYPHKIVETTYTDYAPVHDATDVGMIASPRNWYEVEQITTTCPDVPVNYEDGEAHCKANGDSLINKSHWVSLNYFGDGIAVDIPTTVVLNSNTRIFNDGHGKEHKLITYHGYEIRADVDEYLVRKTTIRTKDYSQSPAPIVSFSKELWGNQLRELIHQYEFIYEGGTKTAMKTRAFDYDQNGLIKKKIESQEWAKGGRKGTQYEYDELGLTVTKETNPLGHVKKYVTDFATGATLLTQGPNTTVDSDGNEVYERSQLVVDGLGRTLEKYVSVDDEIQGYIETLVERISYLDFLFIYKGATGTRVTTESLNSDGTFSESTTIFDGLKREVYTEQVSAETANAETRYRWDSSGHLTRIDIPDPSTEGQNVNYRFSYDSLGRQTQVTGPSGEVLSTTRYEGLTTILSEMGEVNAPAAEKRLTHNVVDQLVKVEEKLDDGSYAVTTYEYDGGGNMAVITDPEGVVTLMMHDTAGRRIAIAAGGESWEYEYDYGDNLITIINPHPEGEAEAYTTRMEYDVLNRMTRRTPASADLSPEEKNQFSWGETINVYDEPHPSVAVNARNSIGRLGYSSSPVVTNIFKYNAQGQATEHRQIMEVNNLDEVSGVELVNNASYHENGQLQLNSLHDVTAGKTLVEDLLHEYDSRGLPRRVSANVEIARFIRNHAGLVTRRETAVAGERINATYLYDKLGRITFLGTEQSPSGIRQFNQWYSYYANGMVKEIKEKPVDKAFRTIRFTWDTRHQVKNANQIAGIPGYSATFDYDRAGRLLNSNVALSSTNPDILSKTRVYQRDVRYAYDAIDPQRVNRLIRNSDNSTYADYDYDRAGNIIKRVIGDTTWELRYDGENRLRKVTNMTDGTAEIYYYDGPDRVLSVRQANDVVNKVRRWFAGGEIHYQNGIRDKNWYYVKEGQTLARIENGTEIEFMFQTPQGHEALSMKADGTVNSSKVYGPFGEVLYAELAGDKSSEDYTREFNGKDYDAVSGLHYYGHRYYDPIGIIWNRADPMFRFVPDKGYTDPRKANLYVYTANNPISLLDPDGLNPIIAGLISYATETAISTAKSEATNALWSFFSESPTTAAINEVVFSDSKAIDFGVRLRGGLENIIFNAAGSRFQDGYVISPAAQGVLSDAINQFSESSLEIERATEAVLRAQDLIREFGGDIYKPESNLSSRSLLIRSSQKLIIGLNQRINDAGKRQENATNRIRNIMKDKNTFCKPGDRGCKTLPKHRDGVLEPQTTTNHGREE